MKDNEIPLPPKERDFCWAESHTDRRKMRKIAIQGIKGSFHDIAAHQYFAGEELELVECASFEALFDVLRKDDEALGLVAIENTIAGSLLHNYELLRESGKTVVGEHKLHIEHALMCLPDDGLGDIREVNSHPVALAQCRGFLTRHSGMKIVEVEDTAGAAERISREKLHGHAAICHADAARLYGMRVLERSIEDNKHNYTRFLVLSDEKCADTLRCAPQTTKASIVFATPHTEGALSQVLSIFTFYRINLSKIQSLPIIGREWQYLFYVDVCYDDYARYRQSIEAVRPLTKDFKILGEYAGK